LPENNKLIVIVGPTAVGKTALAIELGQLINGEIISADSVQIYKYLDIGSAKPTISEQKKITHHLIDIIEPDVPFSVADYQKLAKVKIKEINAKNKIPILVGGTGLYVQSVIDDYDFSKEEGNYEFREQLKRISLEKGNDFLYEKLKKVDPVSASKIHKNDVKRIIRALEVYYKTGKRISEVKDKRYTSSPYDLIFFGLRLPRDELYRKIDLRVDQMIEEGLLEETKKLLNLGYSDKLNSMQSLGYKEMIQYLKGELDWDEAISLLKRNTRRFAKRQLTWFKRDKRIIWIDKSKNIKEDTYKMLEIIEGKWDILTNTRNNQI
jgi:tRNA dimethylallyltransferase